MRCHCICLSWCSILYSCSVASLLLDSARVGTGEYSIIGSTSCLYRCNFVLAFAVLNFFNLVTFMLALGLLFLLVILIFWIWILVSWPCLDIFFSFYDEFEFFFWRLVLLQIFHVCLNFLFSFIFVLLFDFP